MKQRRAEEMLERNPENILRKAILGMLKREGNSLVFTTSDGEVIKKFRKAWEKNDDGCLDKVMADFANQKAEVSTQEETADE